MRTRRIESRMLIWCCAALAAIAASAEDQSPGQVSWNSTVTGQSLPLRVLLPQATRADTPLPTVIYLKHLAATRVGTESDEVIVRDLRAAGYLVATLDYMKHPQARVPFINRDLAKIRDDVLAGEFLRDYQLDKAHTFIVPSGCRLMRDVPFYRDDGRTLAMDVVYPSKPKRPVGAILEFSCDNRNRMGDFSLSFCSDTILEGEATKGFAVAMADHPVGPAYKGLDPMPECAWKTKAAVRTLRAVGGPLGLNGRIASVGFSRGSGMALLVVTTEGLTESEGHGMHQDESSAVQGAVIMSGRFSYLDLLPEDHMWPRYIEAWGERDANLEVWRRQGALDYLTRATIPLFLTINCAEDRDALHQMVVLRERLARLGNDEIFMMDRAPRGHKVTLDPDILQAMDAYLKVRLTAPDAFGE